MQVGDSDPGELSGCKLSGKERTSRLQRLPWLGDRGRVAERPGDL